MSTVSVDASLAETVYATLRDRLDDMLGFLEVLVTTESPTGDPEAQVEVQRVLSGELHDLDFETTRLPGGADDEGRPTGPHLYARPSRRASGQPVQLLMGHCDTVWPHGTLREMPFEVDRSEGVVRGPGVFDMKAGLTQMIFALRALDAAGVDLAEGLEVAPIVFVNSDEEKGSPTSHHHVVRLARCSNRALVVEPALGRDGKIKTSRKGSGRFRVRIRGKSAHAGLDPEAGSSAILELSHVVQQLHALNDAEAGISVNVGTIDGGTRPNVIAAESTAEVDVRVTTHEQARHVEAAIRQIEATMPGTSIEVEGALSRPPMTPTPGARRLWERAQETAGVLGFDLDEGRSGGVSDGNVAAQHTATLDGLGAVGDGAHARHEFCFIDALPKRSALLAMLIAGKKV